MRDINGEISTYMSDQVLHSMRLHRQRNIEMSIEVVTFMTQRIMKPLTDMDAHLRAAIFETKRQLI